MKRAATLVLLLLATIALVGVGWPLYEIWKPAPPLPAEADAIAVLAYGDDRQRLGRELATEGLSHNLVVSNSQKVQHLKRRGASNRSGGRWLEECNTDYPDYRAWCIRPVPNNTSGEAIAFAGLAAEQGWDSVIVVTERSHLHRALREFTACFPGRVYGAASEPTLSPGQYLDRSLYELAAYYSRIFGAAQCA